MVEKIKNFLKREMLLVSVIILGAVFFALAFTEHNGKTLAEGQFEHNLTISEVGDYKVVLDSGDTAYDALNKVTSENNIELNIKQYDFGKMIVGIGAKKANNDNFWALYLNNVLAESGAEDIFLKEGDSTEWKYEKIEY